MRLSILVMLVVMIVNVFVDYLIWRRIVRNSHLRWPGVAYAWSSLLLLIVAIVAISLPRRGGSDTVLLIDMWLLYFYFSIYLPKYFYLIISSIGRLPRLWHGRCWSMFEWIGGIVAFVTFIIMWWSAAVNRLNYQVREVTVEFADLPAAFDGYRIAQFSDFHVGTYGHDTAYVSKIVDVINELHPDAVVFTGDIVNRRTEELTPFIDVLSRISARDGVYSILGNHDYGDYVEWPSAEAKKQNLAQMKQLHGEMGWKLLDNKSDILWRGGDSIAMIGVENVGDPPFTVYGDLDKSYPDLADSTFKILLSHNPAHWVKDIADNDSVNIDLTLSGHTHAMQMQIGSWSPAKWRYPTWGGLYDDRSESHKLYVNIGLGAVGIPARVGATPEITLITLKRGR